jgi:hypothetical protein
MVWMESFKVKIGKRQKTRGKRQEIRDKRQEAQDKRHKTRGKRQEAQDKMQKTRGNILREPFDAISIKKLNISLFNSLTFELDP